MMLAMSQGNDGSMCTIHADSSLGVFNRLQMYMAMTPERFDVEVTNLMVANALHFVVHLARLDTNERVVTSVREITGADGALVTSNEIYAPDVSGRARPRFTMRDTNLSRLERAGFDPGFSAAHACGSLYSGPRGMLQVCSRVVLKVTSGQRSWVSWRFTRVGAR